MNFLRQYNDGFDSSSFDVEVTEVVLATPETPVAEMDEIVMSMLLLLRERLGMRVAFVFAHASGLSVCRHEDRAQRNGRTVVQRDDARKAGWTRSMIHAVPELLGAAADMVFGKPAAVDAGPASAPVVLRDGRTHGTLLCFGPQVHMAPSARDVRYLRYAARFIADKIDAGHAAPQEPAPARAPAQAAAPAPSAWELTPLDRKRPYFR